MFYFIKVRKRPVNDIPSYLLGKYILNMYKSSIICVILGIMLYYYKDQIYTQLNFYKNFSSEFREPEVKLFTVDELKTYNGVDSEFLYLSVLGKVYDVTAGKRHYGPSSSYHIFIGRDASKSFITGEFSVAEDLDDVLELSHEQLLDLQNWSQLYEKQYIYKGKLIGRFYDLNGRQTEYYKMVDSKVTEANQLKLKKELEDIKYPPCNSEWDATSGSRVWCTKKSGGIERAWEGVPRMLYTTGSSEPRCVCIKNKEDAEKNSNVKEYTNCNSSSTSCFIEEMTS